MQARLPQFLMMPTPYGTGMTSAPVLPVKAVAAVPEAPVVSPPPVVWAPATLSSGLLSQVWGSLVGVVKAMTPAVSEALRMMGANARALVATRAR